MTDDEKSNLAKKGFLDQIQSYRKDDLKQEQVKQIIEYLGGVKQITIGELAKELGLSEEFVQIKVEELILIGKLSGTLERTTYRSE
ncbi:MAG: PCI domain-containing protein [Candidatus Helarchaeales archaeon]